MLKKLSALTLSLIFVLGIAGLALAGNTSTVDQTGLDNEATVVQDGDFNNSDIDQVSFIIGNVATTDQTGNSNIADQDQDGNNNLATIEQRGDWPPGPVVNEVANQTQVGDDNRAEIKQITDSGNGNSTASQNQEGTANNARAWQFSWFSNIVQNQDGNDNEAHAFQTGNDGSILQTQIGDDNWAAVDEQGGGGWTLGNVAEQYQDGYRNKSLIAQYGAGGTKTAEGNEAYVSQTGDDNWAGEGWWGGSLFGIYQEGNYNDASITQLGNNNDASATQIGDDNSSTQSQTGVGHSSTVVQTGDLNVATVVQGP